MKSQAVEQLTNDIQNESSQIESQAVEQLTNDIQNESSQTVNNCDVDAAINNEDISTVNSQNKHSSINPDTVELNDDVGEQKVQKLENIIKKELAETCGIDIITGQKICKP